MLPKKEFRKGSVLRTTFKWLCLKIETFPDKVHLSREVPGSNIGPETGNPD
jgi:hypothetical protein